MTTLFFTAKITTELKGYGGNKIEMLQLSADNSTTNMHKPNKLTWPSNVTLNPFFILHALEVSAKTKNFPCGLHCVFSGNT